MISVFFYSIQIWISENKGQERPYMPVMFIYRYNLIVGSSKALTFLKLGP